MEQELLLSCLAIFVNKTDYVNTNTDSAETDNTKETELPF